MTWPGDHAPLPEAVLRGIREFNERRYYECHGTLEIVWREERGPMRAMLHGLIQVAVALLQLARANFKGCTSLLNRAIGKLRDLPPAYRGVDVAGLLAATEETYAAVLSLGPMGMAKFPWDQAPKIRRFNAEHAEGAEKSQG